jgi:steroid 5-alpha reductase family enzyme
LDPLLSLFATTLAIAALAMLCVFALSLWLRDASIVDIYWGPGFAVIAAAAYGLGAGGERAALAAILTGIWGARLGIYLFWRNAGAGEDPRYQAMRRRWGDDFPRKSLVNVFGLQGALMWFVSLPVQVVQLSGADGLGILDALGVAIFATGLAFESLGDFQLARFRADPANQAKVMDRGLWRYTRHPNYFGDCLVWWGLFTIGLSTPLGVFTLASPLLMTFFLTRVSGVALLERSIGKRRPGYADYVRRTSAFVPRRPRD